MTSNVEPSGTRGQSPLDGEEFLHAIAIGAPLPRYPSASEAAVSTIHHLLDRLPFGEARRLLRAIPPGVRSLLDEDYAERQGRAAFHFGRAELVERVARDLAVAPAFAERVVVAVFHALADVLPEDEREHLLAELPRDLQRLWRTPLAEATAGVINEVELLRWFFAEIERSGSLPVHVSARDAFTSVMCRLSQHLSGGEARDVLLGLPQTVRPFVERCMLERTEPSAAFGADALIVNVGFDLGTTQDEAERIIRAVLHAVPYLLPAEEIDHVSRQLPADLRALWNA
jgi:uncharacterized protein (DUF2267 family)